MSKSTNPYTPKTREEFEAYCRAMDEANEAVIRSALQQEGATQSVSGRKPTPQQDERLNQQNS